MTVCRSLTILVRKGILLMTGLIAEAIVFITRVIKEGIWRV